MSYKIFLSGGSGLGKSKFCEQAAGLFYIEFHNEMMRERFAVKEFCDLAYVAQQMALMFDYIELHNSEGRGIVDRSILDVFAWNYRWVEVINFLKKDFVSKPALVIVVPTPSVNYYIKNIDFWKKDPVRFQTWNDKLSISNITDDTELATLLQKSEKELEENIVYMCKQINWKYFLPEIDREDVDNFYKVWQEPAMREVQRIYGRDSYPYFG